MSPAERIFFERARRRVAGMEPEIQRVILRALQTIRDSLNDAELARVIASGNLDGLFAEALSDAALDRAMLPVRDRIRRNLQQGFKFVTADLPKGGKVDGVLAVAFDHLSPNVIAAIRTLETAVVTSLKQDIRDVVLAHVENGLRDGRAPASVAREIRGIIGLTPSGETAARNFRAALESGDVAKALGYQLRDKRFDGTIRRLLGPDGTGLTAEKIDTMVSAYQRRFLANNAETVAKTATFDSYKLGQKLAWQDAQDNGVIPNGYVVMRQWVHFDAQPDPRPEHIAMGKLPPVPADEPYTNGDAYAGESDPWNCKCIDRFFLAKAV